MIICGLVAPVAVLQLWLVRSLFSRFACHANGNETTGELKRKLNELSGKIKPLMTDKFPCLSDTLPKRSNIYICIQQLLVYNSEIKTLMWNISELPQNAQTKKRDRNVQTLENINKNKNEKISDLIALLEYDLTNLLGLASQSDNVAVLKVLIEDMERNCAELKELHGELTKLKNEMTKIKNMLRRNQDVDIADVQEDMSILQRLEQFDGQIDVLKMSIVDINELIKCITKNEDNDQKYLKGFEEIKNFEKLKDNLQSPKQIKKLRKIRDFVDFHAEMLERFRDTCSRENGLYIIKKLLKEVRFKNVSELIAEIQKILVAWSHQSTKIQEAVNADIVRVDNMWKNRHAPLIVNNVFRECTSNVKTQVDELTSLLQLYCEKIDNDLKVFAEIEDSKCDVNAMIYELEQRKKDVEKWLETQTKQHSGASPSIKAMVDLSKREFEVKMYRLGLQLSDTINIADMCLQTLRTLELSKRDATSAFNEVKAIICQVNLKFHKIGQCWNVGPNTCTLKNECPTTSNYSIESEASQHLEMLKKEVSNIVPRFKEFQEVIGRHENKRSTLVISLEYFRNKLNAAKTDLKNEIKQIPYDLLHIETIIGNSIPQTRNHTGNELNQLKLNDSDVNTAVQAS